MSNLFCAVCGAGASWNLSAWAEDDKSYTFLCGRCWNRREEGLPDDPSPEEPEGEAWTGGFAENH